MKNILGEPQNKLSIIHGDSTNLQEVSTPVAVFLEGPITQNKRKLENRRLGCEYFSEVWYETHQYLNWLSKIEGIS
jgi:hypothetical protein